MDMDRIRELRKIIDESDNIVFFGGAGVSTESGIPDFRSADGIYNQDLGREVSPEEMKQLLLKDPYWGEKVLLMFTSPRGYGLKVFVEIDLDKCDYATWFNAIRNYLMQTYGLGEKQVDSSVANISHACFVSYDPDAYLRADLYEFYI